MDQGSTGELKFRGMCADGRKPGIMILRKPDRGTLYQVVDLEAQTGVWMNKRYEDFPLAETHGLLGPEINEFPALVTSPHGARSL